MTNTDQLFFELIKVAIGKQECLSCRPTDEEWARVFEICKEQTLVGIGYSGVQKLQEEQRPQEMLMLKWLGMAAKMQQRNRLINSALGELCALLNDNDVAYAVVKGQVLGSLYDDGLSELRAAGDVDFYVAAKDYKHAKSLIEKCFGVKVEGENEADKHDTFEYKNVRFEMHYRLETFGSSKHQRYFDALMDDAVKNNYAMVNIDGVNVHTLPYEEHVVMTFKHLFNHLLVEGVGLRQFLDLQMLLRYGCAVNHPMQKERLITILRGIGYTKAFTATCAVLVRNLGMDKEICPVGLSSGDYAWADKIISVPMSRGNFGMHNRTYIGSSWRRSLETAKIAMGHCLTFMPLAWVDIACLIPRRISISIRKYK